jgi:hypothetical protein
MIAHIHPSSVGWRVIVDDGDEIEALDITEAQAWLEVHYTVPASDPQPDGSGGFITCVSRREEQVSA